MNSHGEKFLQELADEMAKHPNKEDILTEYEAHVYEILAERSEQADDFYECLVERLGTPREIAKLWRQESGVTPKRIQWLFVIFNIVIFVGGSLLTVLYQFYQWDWLVHIWQLLMDIPTIIFIIYVLFWMLLGYEIGREFGHKGLKILRRTFIFSIIPNIILMYLIVFKILPYEWFGTLLTGPFIIICIVFTFCLYPISIFGYRWGKRVSI